MTTTANFLRQPIDVGQVLDDLPRDPAELAIYCETLALIRQATRVEDRLTITDMHALALQRAKSLKA